MPRYTVNFETIAIAYVTVEADDEESAIEAAFDEIPSEVCARCSGWGRGYGLDLGEWDLPRGDGKGEADWAVKVVEP